jgi:hypothetical protein
VTSQDEQQGTVLYVVERCGRELAPSNRRSGASQELSVATRESLGAGIAGERV